MGRKIKIKDMTNTPFRENDEKDFHIRTVEEEMLISSHEGLDDEEEFVCDMHNFGDSDDLPNSDRAMMTSRQRCDYP